MVLKKLAQAIIDMDIDAAARLTKEALDAGNAPQKIIDEALIGGMKVVGERFRENEMFIPEVLMAARAMHAGLDILKPLLIEGQHEPAGVLVIATVKGDVHDIGKNLVAMMFEGAGFKVIDLGTDVAPDAIVKAVKEQDPDLVGLSTLLTTTLPSVETTIKALSSAGVRGNVKVMIGGAAVTKEFAHKVGADGYAENANNAVELGLSLIGK
jgi:5-methyltetrahydrofolate--homocysteine methyltransferase